MLKKWKWIIDLSFYCGVGLGLYALVSAYMGTANGSCPIDARRPLMVVAIILLIASVAGQWLLEKNNKRNITITTTTITDTDTDTATATDTDTDTVTDTDTTKNDTTNNDTEV